MGTASSFPRDANRVPMQQLGFKTQNSQTLSANNTTATTALFSVTGTVLFNALYGIVTTVLSSNITAAYYEIADQTATPDITLASGTALSAATVGSMISRTSVAGVAIVLSNASAGRVQDPVAATAPGFFMPFAVVQKTAAVLTTVNFNYTTTNAPATGVIQHSVCWIPLSDDGNVVAV